MSKHPYELVMEFHHAFGHPVAHTVQSFPPIDRRNLRLRLIEEEFIELQDADANDDIVEIADALADLIYVICGMALEYGVPLMHVFEEVHRSNMSKLGEDGNPVYREDGKIMKGPNYSPPDIARVLAERQK